MKHVLRARLKSGTSIYVTLGDITRMATDVIVNAANEKLDHRGGLAAAISNAGNIVYICHIL